MTRHLCAFALALALLTSPTGAAAQATSPPGTERIPFKEDAGEVGTLTLKSFLIMAAIFGVAWAGVHLLRKRGMLPPARSAEGKSIRVVESVRLGTRTTLCVVEFDSQRLLLAESERGVKVISRSAPPGAGS